MPKNGLKAYDKDLSSSLGDYILNKNLFLKRENQLL
ncbi:hypothetical protein NEOC95_000383 [Neochlamydia sp. AcF95]|nr:hypothetical protein [Neochlamydia sp. AcF95]